ncbi:DUF6470 family protein [Porcipelethomonas sp.]|uniref:DUF6470 family protein n=1 Tax=Porcipelethomonas sp. TaxID=2981675 RepID=UPI003EF4CD61
MQLIKITSVPLKYTISTENARLTVPQIEPAEMNQKTTPLKINIDTEPVKMRMDSSECLKSMGMKSVADYAKEAPAKTQQTTNEVTAEYVQMGNKMTQPGMTIAEVMREKSLSNTTIETVIGSIPSVKIDMSWEPASAKFDVRRSKSETDWKTAAQEMEFIPSSIRLEIEQYADVIIEYIGGHNYVPPSSNPDYEENE